MIKKLTLILLLVGYSIVLLAQSTDSILNSKVGKFELESLNKLKENGLLSDMDTKLLGVYMVKKIQDAVDLENLTYGQLIDSLNLFKQKMNDEIKQKNNFGADSIFVRNPFGEKIFIGMGEMSLEELVERESIDLPKKYSSQKLNEKFRSPSQISEIISSLKLDRNLSMLLGNTMLIKLEYGEDLSNYKIGDFVEVAKRIKNSKEFKPFLKE